MMNEQLELFEPNYTSKRLGQYDNLDEYTAKIRENQNLDAFVTPENILLLSEMVRNSSFTWSETVEGTSYWNEVSERLALIGMNIRPRVGSLPYNSYTITRHE